MSTRRAARTNLLDAALLLTAIFVCHFAAAQTRPATSQAATRPVDLDLFGWWRADRADETAAPDLSGNGHSAKPARGRIVIEEVGQRRGFRFTREGTELNAGTSGEFDFTADFTAALWVKLNSDVGDVTLLAKRSADGSNGWAIVHGIRGIGGVGFLAAPRVIVPTPCKALEDWVHVAITFRRRDFLLYIDGKAIGVMELPVVPLASKEALVLGAAGPGKSTFDGWLDDVRIYHRGLSATEVEALAAGKEPANPYTPLSAAEEKWVRDLVKALGADSYPEREKAAQQLKEMGRRIAPLLGSYRDSEDVETSVRIKQILGDLPRGETAK
jgi:hypothetical protein